MYVSQMPGSGIVAVCNTSGVSSASRGGAADVARRLDLSLGLLAAGGRPA